MVSFDQSVADLHILYFQFVMKNTGIRGG